MVLDGPGIAVSGDRDLLRSRDHRVPVIKRHYSAVLTAGGLVLIAMGVLIWTGELATLNAEAQRAMTDLGLNFFNQV